MPKPDNLVSLFLDSGAFGAWSNKTTIDLKKYMAYIKQHEKYLKTYVVLDVLPFGEEQRRSPKAIEECANQSYRNLQTMKDAGLKPLPVFHQGERLYWLEQMLKDGEPYIGISTRKDLPAILVQKWLDEMLTILTNRDGKPIVKLHGFGITKPAFLWRYPWYSVDSTTWSLNAGYGRIMVPGFTTHGADYRNPKSILVSGVPQAAHRPTLRTVGFATMGNIQQDWIREYLKSIGLSLSDVRYLSDKRRVAILKYYQGLEETLTNVTFQNPGRTRTNKKAAKFDRLHIYFATMISNASFSQILTDAGANERLLSYFEMKDRPSEQLIEYVTTGLYKNGKARKAKGGWKDESYLNRRRAGLLKLAAKHAEADNGAG